MAPPALAWISRYRWPLGIVAILSTSVAANAVLLYQATRPDAARPMPDYYQRSLEWDADLAVREASRSLGWQATVALPEGAEYLPAMPRPVDVTVTDREGRPVTGLHGTLTATRPSDQRLDSTAEVVEMPHRPGAYRALLRFPANGLWEIEASLRQGEMAWVASRRLTVTASTPATGSTP